jgi:hypothetical protein
MQACESTQYATVWQGRGVAPRSYVRFAAVVWIAAFAALAAVPWSALAWMFIAD